MPTSSELQAIRSELDTLKAQNRRLRWIVSVAIVAVFAALLTGMVGPQEENTDGKVIKADEIEAKSIVLRDDEARPRVIIEFDPGLECHMNPQSGNDAVETRVYARSRIRFLNREGKKTMELSASEEEDATLSLNNDEGVPLVHLWACSRMGGLLFLRDTERKDRIIMGTEGSGESSVLVSGRFPNSSDVRLSSTPEGSCSVQFTDPHGKTIRKLQK